jgi:hypothetical protein
MKPMKFQMENFENKLSLLNVNNLIISGKESSYIYTEVLNLSE